MPKYLTAIVLLIAVGGTPCFGQTLPTIETDRPDQTESAAIVPKKHLQVETGLSYEREDEQSTSWLHPSILWKYGVNDRFELRLITELETTRSGAEKLFGLSPVTVGFKVNLAQENGIFPRTSFIGHLTLPGIAAAGLSVTHYAPAFRFTMEHSLSSKLKLSYNVGSEWNGETAEPTFIYTLSTGWAISDKIGSYVEVYGFAPQKQAADHRMDAGLTYLVRSNLQFDISGGFGLTSNAPDYYGALGFSFRLKD
jgi:hypothetical protein